MIRCNGSAFKILHKSILAGSLFFTSLTHADNLRIAVAANFYNTLQLIKERFENEHDHTLTLIRGSTGKLYAQIKHGAPYDVFMAADVRRPEILEQEKRTLENSRITYAIGKLVLWSARQPEKVHDTFTGGNYNKLAIANPKTAPYGQAAIEVMQHLGIYQQIKSRLVYGENILQAYQFVQSGSASLGFVALAHVKSSSSSYWMPPDGSYQKLQQQMVVLSATRKPELARTFLRYIQSEHIKTLIRNQGYGTL